MPDDHSELVPLLPIPNRTVKQLRADDSAGSRVKVGHRQALTALKPPSHLHGRGVCLFTPLTLLPPPTILHTEKNSDRAQPGYTDSPTDCPVGLINQ